MLEELKWTFTHTKTGMEHICSTFLKSGRDHRPIRCQWKYFDISSTTFLCLPSKISSPHAGTVCYRGYHIVTCFIWAQINRNVFGEISGWHLRSGLLSLDRHFFCPQTTLWPCPTSHGSVQQWARNGKATWVDVSNKYLELMSNGQISTNKEGPF